MLNWFKQKKYPAYWEDYLHHFEKTKELNIESTRFVIFDTETTGLNPGEDRILSIGCVAVVGNTINISDIFEIYIKQDKFNVDTVEFHGILKEGKISKVEEPKALIQFLEYIKNSILVAHHAAFDVAMINEGLKRLDLPKLKNKFLDTGILFKKTTLHKAIDKHYRLDELCDIFNIKKQDRHTASGDAFITGLIFLKILSNLKNTKKITVKDLFFNFNNKRGLI